MNRIFDSTPRLNPVCFLSPLLSIIASFNTPYNSCQQQHLELAFSSCIFSHITLKPKKSQIAQK